MNGHPPWGRVASRLAFAFAFTVATASHARADGKPAVAAKPTAVGPADVVAKGVAFLKAHDALAEGDGAPALAKFLAPRPKRYVTLKGATREAIVADVGGFFADKRDVRYLPDADAAKVTRLPRGWRLSLPVTLAWIRDVENATTPYPPMVSLHTSVAVRGEFTFDDALVITSYEEKRPRRTKVRLKAATPVAKDVSALLGIACDVGTADAKPTPVRKLEGATSGVLAKGTTVELGDEGCVERNVGSGGQSEETLLRIRAHGAWWYAHASCAVEVFAREGADLDAGGEKVFFEGEAPDGPGEDGAGPCSP